jgi:hypothetical protein
MVKAVVSFSVPLRSAWKIIKHAFHK